MSNTNLNQLDGFVTTDEAVYRDPKVFPPPLNTKLHVLTIGGIDTTAHWKDDAGFIAWYPLIKIPPWAKEVLSRVGTGGNPATLSE